MEEGGPFRGGQKPEQIAIFWNYASLSYLVEEVNGWLRKNFGKIELISCQFIRGNYILVLYRDCE